MLLSVTSKIKKNSDTLKVGKFDSVVTDICFHPDYCAEEALLVKYQLSDEKGLNYAYEEVFFNKESNLRTQDFFQYLIENGIPLENFTEFKGCKEKISLKKTVRGNRPMLTIDDRKFVSPPERDEKSFKM